MKAKYLFYSLALASAFTACTQEELFEAPALESNEVANRPVAGVVTFVNDEVDSRYNRQDASFEKNDKLGLYLMDSFTYKGEKDNRNGTYWQWQSCWWDMYDMENYISSNYAYVNDGNNNWVNHASRLVEGNYIALFPQNEVATNRAELWHPIKANVDLVAHSTKKRYYVNRDNQFFVGYEQIHRDQEAQADGNLEAKISMKPILTYARMKFDNNQADMIRLKKVVFTLPNNVNLPNVAFIEPENIAMTDEAAQTYLGVNWDDLDPMMAGLEAPYWAWSNREAMAEYDANTLCGEEQAPYRQGKYDRTTFTHAAARSMVRYATTGPTPYGFDARTYAASREYTFNFPGDGVILKGNEEGVDKTLTRAEISIALPAFENWGDYDWNDMKVVVYADKLKNEDAEDEEWVAGYIASQSKVGPQGLVNADWNLGSLSLWDNDKMSDFGTVELRIDDEYFVALNEIEVSSDKDFYNLVKGRLADANTAKEVKLTVKPYEGTTLNVNADVVQLIDAYEAKWGDKVDITFTGDVQLNAANSIHKFIYAGVNVTLNADQEVTEKISYTAESTDQTTGVVTPATGIKELINSKTLTVLSEIAEGVKVTNSSVMVVKTDVVKGKTSSGKVHTLSNNGFLTLNNGATVTYLTNNGEAEVEAGDNGIVTVAGLANNGSLNNCEECSKAVLDVTTGTLKVTSSMTNKGVVNVYGTLEAKKIENQDLHTHADGTLEAVINNKGVIKSNYLVNNATINTYGDFIGVTAEGGQANPKLKNNAVVNGYGGNLGSFDNGGNGELYVKTEDIHVSSYAFSLGKIIFEGVKNGHVTGGNSERIFQTTADMKGSEIDEAMLKTAATHIWLSNNLTIDYNATTGECLWTVARRNLLAKLTVKTKKSVKFLSEVTEGECHLMATDFVVESEGKLTIEDALKMTVKSFKGSIDVTTGAVFKDVKGNTPTVNHK